MIIYNASSLLCNLKVIYFKKVLLVIAEIITSIKNVILNYYILNLAIYAYMYIYIYVYVGYVYIYIYIYIHICWISYYRNEVWFLWVNCLLFGLLIFIYYIVFYLDFVLSKQACYNFCEYVVLTLTYIMFLLCH